MRNLILTVILLFVPTLVHAEKVVILPVSYIRAQTGEQVSEAASKIEDKVAEGAVEAGFEIVRGEVVQAVLDELSKEDGICAAMSRECLKAVADKLGADEAIFLSATDEDQTSYKIEVALANRKGNDEERTAGFFVVLEWVRGSVALILQKPTVAVVQSPIEENETEVKEPVENDDSEHQEVAKEEEKEDKVSTPEKTGLSPVPFYVSAAVTGALFVSWGITDIVVHKRYKDLKEGDDGDSFESRRNDAMKLQTADRVLLGLTLAGAVTTGVLFFLTDFQSESDDQSDEGEGASAWLVPAASENAGMLVLQGSF